MFIIWLLQSYFKDFLCTLQQIKTLRRCRSPWKDYTATRCSDGPSQTLTHTSDLELSPVCCIILPSYQFPFPSSKQLPSCTLVEMWSYFRPQSPWAQSARAQSWNSSVGRAGLGAVQSAEFLYRSTLCCCPHYEQLGSAGSATSSLQERGANTR